MEKVTFVEMQAMGQIETHAIIEHQDGSFTSMSKEEYDRRQVEHLTSPLTDPTA